MNVYMALSLFSLVILLYWIITEMFTILFRLTGLPDERARFQVISLLTGCGYTTKESELFLSSRSRRRLARVTMLFGYVFNITVISAFINVFLSLKASQVENFFMGILIPLGVVAVIFLFMRVPRVRAWGDGLLQRLADKLVVYGEDYNNVLPIDHIGTDSIAQVTLKHIPQQYAGLSLAQTNLRADTGILVMLVERSGGEVEAAGPDTVFALGDKLTVFGDYRTICRTFHAKESFDELWNSVTE